ncbi:GGDEF domain-containing protein [Balneatrix alpica]|uniref:diguanylate cyclase n=1 Tax=Balneatrix alpica TaxID=75684 RepID=A0ABV5ZEW7_9GAMM|nr:GGDEF domain-containing protein [Balneatrix alpica]
MPRQPQQKLKLYQAVLDHSRAVIGAKAPNGQYLLANKEFERLFGLTDADILGHCDKDIFPLHIAQAFRAADLQVIASGAPLYLEEIAVVDGQERHYLSVKFPIWNDLSEMIATGFVATDITERIRIEKKLIAARQQAEAANQQLQQAMHKLEILATTDQLTGLWNRRKFEQLAQHALAAENQPSSLVLMDLDRFKEVNDRFGHSEGDRVLSELATLLRTELAPIDTLARWGGEEFALLLYGQDNQQALALTERLSHTLQQHLFSSVGHLSFSAGIACYQPGESLSDWFSRADTLLYASKRQGRNCICC